MFGETKDDDLHQLSGPLTEQEIRELRQILHTRKQYRWLITTFRLWLGYLSGTLVSLYVLWDYVEKFLKRIFP